MAFDLTPPAASWTTAPLALNTERCPQAMMRDSWHIKDFALVKEIGSGAVSCVYFALCRKSCLRVAIKVYQKAKLSQLNAHQVQREIAIHASLNHPHIVDLYAAFEDETGIYLVLEYAEGGDLFDAVKRRGGRLQEAMLVQQVLYPYLCALMYLHGRGIVHRDIKPENTVITRNHVLKITDFGLAVSQRLERPVTRLGTLDYMAPEVLKCPDKHLPQDNKHRADLAYTEAVDTWALGVLAYELIVGRPPFGMADRAGTMQAICHAQPAMPDWVSPGAAAFITMALDKSPATRAPVARLLQHPWIVAAMLQPSNGAEVQLHQPAPAAPPNLQQLLAKMSRSVVESSTASLSSPASPRYPASACCPVSSLVGAPGPGPNSTATAVAAAAVAMHQFNSSRSSLSSTVTGLPSGTGRTLPLDAWQQGPAAAAAAGGGHLRLGSFVHPQPVLVESSRCRPKRILQRCPTSHLSESSGGWQLRGQAAAGESANAKVQAQAYWRTLGPGWGPAGVDQGQACASGPDWGAAVGDPSQGYASRLWQASLSAGGILQGSEDMLTEALGPLRGDSFDSSTLSQRILAGSDGSTFDEYAGDAVSELQAKRSSKRRTPDMAAETAEADALAGASATMMKLLMGGTRLLDSRASDASVMSPGSSSSSCLAGVEQAAAQVLFQHQQRQSQRARPHIRSFSMASYQSPQGMPCFPLVTSSPLAGTQGAPTSLHHPHQRSRFSKGQRSPRSQATGMRGASDAEALLWGRPSVPNHDLRSSPSLDQVWRSMSSSPSLPLTQADLVAALLREVQAQQATGSSAVDQEGAEALLAAAGWRPTTPESSTPGSGSGAGAVPLACSSHRAVTAEAMATAASTDHPALHASASMPVPPDCVVSMENLPKLRMHSHPLASPFLTPQASPLYSSATALRPACFPLTPSGILSMPHASHSPAPASGSLGAVCSTGRWESLLLDTAENWQHQQQQQQRHYQQQQQLHQQPQQYQQHKQHDDLTGIMHVASLSLASPTASPRSGLGACAAAALRDCRLTKSELVGNPLAAPEVIRLLLNRGLSCTASIPPPDGTHPAPQMFASATDGLHDSNVGLAVGSLIAEQSLRAHELQYPR